MTEEELRVRSYRGVTAHLKAGAYAPAEDALRGHVTSFPSDLAALRALSAVLDRQAQREEADAMQRRSERLLNALRKTLVCAPQRSARKEAFERLVGAAKAAPDDAALQWAVAEAFREAGAFDAAATAYRRFMTKRPTDPLAPHLLAVVGGAPAGRQVPAPYVRAHYDAAAEGDYDAARAEVDDRTTEHTAEALQVAVAVEPPPSAERGLRALDLGCGTGACGALMRGWVARLEGVELSPRMAFRARKLGIYDALEVGDLLNHLRTLSGRVAVIAAADVLPYFGPLRDVLSSAHRALEPGGYFAFTLEKAADGPVLQTNGRFAHDPRHVAEAAQAVGFEVNLLEDVPLRTEEGETVVGLRGLVRRRA